MNPIDDPRPFADVLRDWIGRHGGSAYAAAPLLDKPERTVGRWLAGLPCGSERAYRALMTMTDLHGETALYHDLTPTGEVSDG